MIEHRAVGASRDLFGSCQPQRLFLASFALTHGAIMQREGAGIEADPTSIVRVCALSDA
eukprot:m.3580 g.3580  ORF g.3580 m.3580 type:complete len:59 (+) comp2419_c0_seq2:647-823(+)